MSSSFENIDGSKGSRKDSRIRPGHADRSLRKREHQHQPSPAPTPAETEAETEAEAGSVPGKVADYFKQNSEIVKGATKLVEAITHRPAYLPDTFEVFIGGFRGDSYKIELDDDHLIYTSYGEGYLLRGTVEVDPTEEKWVAFWAVLEEIGVWGWQPHYGEQTKDELSTVFSISVEHAGLVGQSAGIDAFPPIGLSLEDSPDFAKFCSAVSRLVGWLAFR